MTEEDAKQAAAAYRRQACFFLSNVVGEEKEQDGVDLFKTMEQHLGQKSLFLDSETTNEASTASTSFSEASDTPDMRAPPCVVNCVGCGSWLQPGHNGTTVRLRSLGRGRTRRRRASRKKAAQIRKRQQSSTKGGRQWKQDEDEGVNSPENINNIFQVTDGQCRNAIIYTCGSCGTKRKVKGLSAKRQEQNDKAPAKKTSPKSQITKNVDTDADFIPIGGKRTSTLPKKIPEPRRKKKRRTKEPEKGSKKELLDFLSSFNDS